MTIELKRIIVRGAGFPHAYGNQLGFSWRGTWVDRFFGDRPEIELEYKLPKGDYFVVVPLPEGASSRQIGAENSRRFNIILWGSNADTAVEQVHAATSRNVITTALEPFRSLTGRLELEPARVGQPSKGGFTNKGRIIVSNLTAHGLRVPYAVDTMAAFKREGYRRRYLYNGIELLVQHKKYSRQIALTSTVRVPRGMMLVSNQKQDFESGTAIVARVGFSDKVHGWREIGVYGYSVKERFDSLAERGASPRQVLAEIQPFIDHLTSNVMLLDEQRAITYLNQA